MKSTKLASRYAKALFQFAKENGQIEEVNKDLALVSQVMKENRDLKTVIESPIIFPDKKETIFHDIFSEKLSKVSFCFLSLLIKKRREPSLVPICDEYVKFYNAHHNIKIAHITTAVEISGKLSEELKKTLEDITKSHIILDKSVNTNIIGGLSIRIDDFIFDATLSSRINKMRSDFSQNIYQAAF